MSEKEAYLAVDPPLTMLDDDTDPSDYEAIDENPYNLKMLCSSSKNAPRRTEIGLNAVYMGSCSMFCSHIGFQMSII